VSVTDLQAAPCELFRREKNGEVSGAWVKEYAVRVHAVFLRLGCVVIVLNSQWQGTCSKLEKRHYISLYVSHHQDKFPSGPYSDQQSSGRRSRSTSTQHYLDRDLFRDSSSSFSFASTARCATRRVGLSACHSSEHLRMMRGGETVLLAPVACAGFSLGGLCHHEKSAFSFRDNN
jgi:hypothetical protein